MPSLPPFDAVIFDCDGTLVDTSRTWSRAYKRLFSDHGITLDLATRVSLISMSKEELGQTLASLLNHEGTPQELVDLVYGMVRTNLGEGIRPLPGVLNTVRALHDLIPLAIATNTPTEIVEYYLDQIGLRNYFEVIIDSHTAGAPKPDPAPYRAACALLGAQEERSLAVEDSEVGVRSAKTAGLTTLCVNAASDHPAMADVYVRSLTNRHVWQLFDLAVP
ncbi:HAD family phosphatase [Nocardiopsis tropica]|uniref:HAD family phosphatase n=1 Tax=Nocardiopsis tropica TaxID=109330 RepID=A0ABU7KJX2_9ACTN|nr:HAD family phosphatase [Nocardiopsis umidischolae]MEE2049601.1 HAD family phosphatase [Nocardiopsis umidischolae]